MTFFNKDKWKEYVHARTDIALDILDKEFDTYYNEKMVKIFNSVSGEYSDIKPQEFLEDLIKNKIIVETGAIFYNHDVFTALAVKTILSYMGLRKEYKKELFKAKGSGDALGQVLYNIAQLAVKLLINIYYGIQANPYSKYYNFDVASSITGRGRSTTSLNGLILEAALGSYRPYNILANIDFIENSSKKNVDRSVLDLCEVPSVEDIVKHITADRYETYYAKDILREKLSKLSDDEKIKVYYASNFSAFIKIPRVKELLKHIMIYNNGKMPDKKEMDKLLDKPNEHYKEILYIDPTSPPKDMVSAVEEYSNLVRQLLVGFYWYEGDINEYGEVFKNPEDIFRSIYRDVVILTDTDSLMPTLEPSMNRMINVIDDYHDITKDIDGNFKELVLGSLVVNTIAILVEEGLKRYTDHSLITASYRYIINFKQEFYFRTLQTTSGSKNYIAVCTAQEGTLLPEEELEVKGLSLKKTNFNKFLSEKALLIAESIATSKDPDVGYLLREIASVRQEIPIVFQQKDNLDIFTVGKLKTDYDDSDRSDYRYKAVENYNILFDSKINLPGSFLTTKVDITGRDEEIEDKYPEIYQRLLQIANDRSIYTTKSSMTNRAIKFWGENIPEEINDIIQAYNEINDLEELKSFVKNTRKANKDKYKKKMQEWIDKMSTKTLKIGEAVDRIAIPIDSETVPRFITDFVDLGDIAVFENLIAVLMKGLGVEVIRNNGGRQIVHNVLSYY